MKQPRRGAVLVWSGIACLGIIILVNLIFHPLTKSLAHDNAQSQKSTDQSKQADTSNDSTVQTNTKPQNPDSLKGDTNTHQQQIQQQTQQQTQEETTQPQAPPSQKENIALPFGKLIDNIPTKDNKTVYLTFDDGPGAYTKDIASIMRKNGINGSYFWIGDQVTDDLGQFGHQMIEQGDVIGSHTMHHDALGKESVAQQEKDLTETASYIENKIGDKIVYFRPPYGSVNKATRQVSKEIHQYIIFWQVDSLDWSLAHNPEKILTNIENGGVKPGSIILMHERKQTVEMLPKVIEYLRSKGYHFAALPASPEPKVEMK
ncbi:polysaccharide deacetylase family protein [Aneurinibacillus terranovensis]|uniref:polysaccharide deacetylase family protein n=1 Tax=Aneurinibacillus terranovensis TaxID=278991 RepID=UPI0009D71BB3|nr:polysaccharide deacetylase family protein [Aneurinibacillus terranovensis]